jgi:diguanylate cyclase (GGDEF)-like protein
MGTLVITAINAWIIYQFGMMVYVRIYFITLTIPYVVLFAFYSIYKWGKLIFAILTVQVLGNVAILNGLLASYLVFQENTPYIDTIARVFTYILCLPILFKFLKPTYLKMVNILDKGWWVLNAALMTSYVLAYFILFVPDAIFNRPNYFIHAYVAIILSLLVYVIAFFLFIEIQHKKDTELDKEILSLQVDSMVKETEKINSIAYIDTLTGVKNRYSLFRQMDQLIDLNQHFLVIFIDLDNFKFVNDEYDHQTGDMYLKRFAGAVEQAIDVYGEVYRFAGDEFVCLITHQIQTFDAGVLRDKIKENMTNHIPYHGVSFGISAYPRDAQNADDLINMADQAMYTEKKAKKIRR